MKSSPAISLPGPPGAKRAKEFAIRWVGLALTLVALGCDAHRSVAPRVPSISLSLSLSRSPSGSVTASATVLNRGKAAVFYSGGCGGRGFFIEVRGPDGALVIPGPCTVWPACPGWIEQLDPMAILSAMLTFDGTLHDCDGPHPAPSGEYTVVAGFLWGPTRDFSTDLRAEEARATFLWDAGASPRR